MSNDAEPERERPEVMDPAEAAELNRTRDFDADTVAEVLRKQREEEERKGRELFGGRKPFLIPDEDTDA